MSQVETSFSGFRFDDFYLDASNRQLSRGGEPVALNSKYFDVLLLLVRRSGQLVAKQRIFEEVWDGVFVTDAALTQCIKDIRKQLGDDASSPRYIKTVPKHGYIFIGTVVDSNGHDGPDSHDLLPANVTASGALRARASRASIRPYKFLDYYTEQDAGLFFGREPEVETICSQIVAHRSFILHGRSGVGKSSIVRAGLMPRLKSEGHLAFVVRSFTDPLHHMENALAQVCAGDLPRAGSSIEDLVAHVASSDPSRCIVFFFDQFEEFFSLLAEQDRAQFLNAARRLTAADQSAVRMVFALREDMLAEMSQLKTAIPQIFHHEYRLTRLSRQQASRAITGPARAVGCRYDQELVERLLDDLGDEDGVDPPQLQIVCDNLFDSRDSAGALTVETYELLGTASQILAGYLERVLNRFNAQTLKSAKTVLKSMISTEGRRLVLKSSQRDSAVAGQNEQDAAETRLIEELIAARVVRRRSQDGEAWLELAHDFLTAEVARWLTADEIALKRARGVIERAMQNFNAHGLMIDADALDLLLPFGEQLDLSDQEADFLFASILNRGRSAPDWLVRTATDAAELITDAGKNSDPEVRLRAVEAAATLKSEQMKNLLCKLALWDQSLPVRRSASIALAEWLGPRAQRVLSEGKHGGVGPVRRAISLAMIRDFDKRLVRLSIVEPLVALLVVGGLMWVRLRRDGAEIVRQGMGGAIGGAASGIVGGLLLGGGLSGLRHESAVETWELLFVLISLGSVIGALGGLFVSFGMVAAARVTYRHSRWWSALGGAAGGALIGGSTKLLGVDTIKAVFGQSPAGITGALEGAVMGIGLSAGATLVAGLFTRARPWQRIVCASIGAMCAGVLLTVVGGNLFSASLEIVTRMFANSRISMDPLASFFGEGHFGQTTQIVLGALEGLLFGAGVAGGIEIAARSSQEISPVRSKGVARAE